MMAASAAPGETKPSTTKAYNDHNVYILGAGFGAEAGLPLIKGFMNKMRDAAAWLEGQVGREREQKAIAHVLEFRLRAAAAAHRVPLDVENIEELFSLASASGDEELEKAMPLAIAATLDYAQTKATPATTTGFDIYVHNLPGWKRPETWSGPPTDDQTGIAGRWYKCPSYDFYVGTMAGYFHRGGSESRNTIITFNYDVLIENGLRNLGISPNLGLSIAYHPVDAGDTHAHPEESLSLLKLHGSVNWSAQSGSNTGDMLDAVTVYDSYSDVLANSRVPLLVPPTWRKTIPGELTHVWYTAVEAMKTATRIVILGYSIPTTDIHFKYLLAAGLQDNISLRRVFFVNPVLKDHPEWTVPEPPRLFGRSGLFRSELREQEIVELIPVGTREFFAGPYDGQAAERYRVRIGRPLNNPDQFSQNDAPFQAHERTGITTWQ